MQMLNASEILRNAGGLEESISQNSLRVLSDFFGGAGIINSKYNIDISAKLKFLFYVCA